MPEVVESKAEVPRYWDEPAPATPVEPTETPAQRMAREVRTEIKRLKDEAEVRASSRELDDLKAELGLERFRATADEHFTACVHEHGRNNVRMVLSDPEVGYVILKTPAQVTLKKFSAQAENVTHEALEDLTRPCLLHPSKDEFDAMLTKKPGLIITCSGAVLELAGIKTQTLKGK